MNEETLKRIFSPFMQADASTTRQYGGTGLGLAISKRIVEGLGGDISADSTLGQGACFTISIPVSVAEQQNETTEDAVYDIENAKDLLKELSILVAEDQEPNRMVMEAILKSSVKKLSFAKNGLEAVALWRRGDVDLILMDIQMPALDGIGATKQIREIETEKNLSPTPIIALTANAFTEQAAQYLAAGMNAHLAKPLDFRALYETVAKCFSNKQKAA